MRQRRKEENVKTVSRKELPKERKIFRGTLPSLLRSKVPAGGRTKCKCSQNAHTGKAGAQAGRCHRTHAVPSTADSKKSRTVLGVCAAHSSTSNLGEGSKRFVGDSVTTSFGPGIKLLALENTCKDGCQGQNC